MTRVLIVTPSPMCPGQWVYKTYADGDRLHFGGLTPESSVKQAFDRCMVGPKDEIHICTDKGIEFRTLADFGLSRDKDRDGAMGMCSELGID